MAWSCLFHIFRLRYSYHLHIKAWHSSPRLFYLFPELGHLGTIVSKIIMKKLLVCFLMLFAYTAIICAQSLNDYKYVVIQHQEDSKKDIEQRMTKEFPLLGFVLLTEDEASQLDAQEKKLLLSAEYLCRQSVQCLFKLKLKNSNGDIVYEDEQVAAAGFMSYKNDRQSAIKKIFKQLKKQNYRFTPLENE